MRTGSIEIESAMIRMSKKIVLELVVVPDESRLDIVLDTAP